MRVTAQTQRRAQLRLQRLTARVLLYIWFLLPLLPALGGIASWLAGVR